jgi:hypothetical protein
MIDHVFTAWQNNNAKINQVNIRIEDNNDDLDFDQQEAGIGNNNSDHRPICINYEEHLDANLKLNNIEQPPATIKARKTMKLDWNNSEIKELYVQNLNAKLEEAKLDISCANIKLKEELEDIIIELHDIIVTAQKQTWVMHNKEKHKQHNENASRPNAPKRRSTIKTPTNEIHQLHNKKNEFNRRWLTTRNPLYRQIYNLYRRKVRKLERTQAKMTANATAIKLSTQYQNDKRKMWMTLEEELGNKSKADVSEQVLRNEYTKMFNPDDITRGKEYQNSNQKTYKNIANKLGTVEISKYMMHKFIESLQNNKAAGKSGIPNEAIKNGGGKLLVLITRIIEAFVNFRYVPRIINIGIIFPIVKDDKKDHTDINNTRPLTLSEVIITLFEKYMLNMLELQNDGHHLQFGFKRNSSTNHAIFMLRETILESKKNRQTVLACFLDYSKAFDKVNRSILLHKLKALIDLEHWATLYDYYENTLIQIRIEDRLLEPIKTTAGVKQGGPLSPKLFSVYTDEMLEELAASQYLCKIGAVNTGIIAYADDTVILCPDEAKLQSAISIIERYCEINEIQINANKTKCMSLNNNEIKKPETTVNNNKIEYVQRFKYLGWWIEKTLSNKEHIKNRKLAMIVSTDRLKKIGLNSHKMTLELKKFLIDVYGKSTLLYGIENTYLFNKDYNELNSLESRIMKNAVGLNKYHSTTLLNDALDIRPIAETVKTSKLKFIARLTKNQTTAEVLESLGRNKSQVSKQSIVYEINNLLDKNNSNWVEAEELRKCCENKITELEEKTNENQNSDIARSVKYLLRGNKPSHMQMVKRLLHWQHSSELK